MDKKIIDPSLRDPKRLFKGKLLQELLEECNRRCSHPFCDTSYLGLKAHHIIQHAHGGLTKRENGLMLCSHCHRLLHDGFIPQRLVFFLKYLTKDNIYLNDFELVTPEELISRANNIEKTRGLSVNDKFTALNDLLINANFIKSINARYFAFVNIIATKVRILNDGTSPLRSSLYSMLISMDQRRKFAQMLASNAFRYAEKIHHPGLSLYFLHSRAVGFNARNNFDKAVSEFLRTLNLLETFNISKTNYTQFQILKSRLIREMGVCRAKDKYLSIQAKKDVLLSLDIAQSVGDIDNINDAFIRCMECFIYLGDIAESSKYLDILYGNWDYLNTHHKAIVMKLDAKHALASKNIRYAEDIVKKGYDFSIKNILHHQSYHFARLNWHIKLKLLDDRNAFIT